MTSKRHEEKAREILQSIASPQSVGFGERLQEAIASAVASTEAELVGRMMEAATSQKEPYVSLLDAPEFLEEFALANSIPMPEEKVE